MFEQDSGFEDLIEFCIEQQEHKEQCIASSAPEACISPPRIHKRGKGRPPRRYDIKFECDICNYTTVYAKHFRTHMSVSHQDEQPRIFKCTQCPEAYVEERFLHEHTKHIHDCVPRQPKFICAKCGKGFPKQSHLKRHSYVHEPNEKPFLCDYCPSRFINLCSLTRHIQSKHNKNKKHMCSDCGKAFGHIYSLKSHKIHMHNKEEI
ncbi:zinc finger protein 189 [Ceratitis capitata]|uniref:(Mediterranean fruit fly) hypothetical protein n=1 Tax=Ceratitis capitata TaxID=7213 RepID=W8BYY0_CERCA|nr:zinc finger protein 189 [Ceratitis capitata]XP_020713549.1 zinc finger protein 189 [Ceratitis capitata]XP_020713550.1 zinc finger protein 189 [Ceratitis capitata]CAD7006065.1 unnamed protein product [Ceratitis capitata]